MVKNEWHTVTLRDICTHINYGYTASASKESIGPKFLRITDIVPSIIDWDKVPYCEIDSRQYKKYKLEKGDIVIARTGATSGYAKCLRNIPESVFASYLVRIRIDEKYNKRFIGLIVESQEYKKYVNLNVSGAAQPQANAQILTSFQFKVPPRIVQDKIVSVIADFDDLIENNNHRIKILREDENE